MEMSDEDFAVIRDALVKATTPYSTDEIVQVVIAERAARRVVDRIDADRQR